MSSPVTKTDSRIRILSWSVLWLTIAVVVGGALVRATDSGAGCGESWPICGGQLVPHIGTYHTAIEVFHRLTTGLLGIVLVTLVVLVRRQFAKDNPLRRSVFAAGMFLILESLLGASLVLFGWVEGDASIARLIVVPVHLINTFLLVGSMALVAYFASGGRPFRPVMSRTTDKLLAVSLGTILVIGASGALNALADTLIVSGWLEDPIPGVFQVSEPVLRQIRAVHPFVSIAGGLVLYMLVRYLTAGADRRVRRLGLGVQGIIWLEIILGLANIALKVPLEIQLIHLFVADVLWVLTLLISFDLLAERSSMEGSTVTRVEAP